MNLIKLNPLKKLMLVVLSWFVHAVYHVEVHAWHIGKSTDVFNDTADFTIGYSGDANFEYCTGVVSNNPDKYYIFPGGTSFVGVYIYYSGEGGPKYSSVNGTLCLTEDEFDAMQSFFGNTGTNWGNFMAINCCDGTPISSIVAATCNTVLKGHMFPVLLAANSSMNSGSGFSSAYSHAYTAAKILIPGGGTNTTQGCTLEPGMYVAGTNAASALDSAFKKCPAGYYCPGGGSIGVGMASLTKNAGLIDCPAGYHCPAYTSSAEICSKGYYAGPKASKCTRCPSTSLYNPDGVSLANPSKKGTWSVTTGTTSEDGAKSVTECYVEPKLPYLLAGEGGVFEYTGACYYS